MNAYASRRPLISGRSERIIRISPRLPMKKWWNCSSDRRSRRRDSRRSESEKGGIGAKPQATGITAGFLLFLHALSPALRFEFFTSKEVPMYITLNEQLVHIPAG